MSLKADIDDFSSRLEPMIVTGGAWQSMLTEYLSLRDKVKALPDSPEKKAASASLEPYECFFVPDDTPKFKPPQNR